MSQRTALADAAITVIAAHGARGLTHRAVDAQAGVAAGTTSAYFRTRQALLEGLVRRLVELDTQDFVPERAATTLGTLSLNEVAEATAAMLDHLMHAGRVRTLARYHVFLEATHRPELGGILGEGLPLRAQMAQLLTALGAPDAQARARHLVAFLDGLLYDRTVGTGRLSAPAPGTAQSRADLADAVRLALTAATAPT